MHAICDAFIRLVILEYCEVLVTQLTGHAKDIGQYTCLEMPKT